MLSPNRFVYRSWSMLIIGTIAAFNKATSGGGYGPLVTAGQIVSGLSSKNAIAITSLAESITCFIGLIAYILLGKEMNYYLAITMVIGAVAAVPLAIISVKISDEKIIKMSIGVFTSLLAIIMAYKYFI